MTDSVVRAARRDFAILTMDPTFRGEDSEGGGGGGNGYAGGHGGGGGGSGAYGGGGHARGCATYSGSYGGGGGGGGGNGAGGSNGPAPHAWLMHDGAVAAAAAARIMHGLGSVALPAARWRASAFWSRYRKYAFEDVPNALRPATPPLPRSL